MEFRWCPCLSRRSVAEFLGAICRPGQGSSRGSWAALFPARGIPFEKTIVLMERGARSIQEMIGE